MRNIDEMVGSLVYYPVIRPYPEYLLQSKMMIMETRFGYVYDHARLRILEGDRVDFIGEVIGPYTYTHRGAACLQSHYSKS